MRFSSSARTLPAAGFGPRLLGALAASAALHALLVSALPAPFGARWGSLEGFGVGAPLRAALRPVPPPANELQELAAARPTGPPPAETVRVPAAAPAPQPQQSRPEARALLPEPHYYLTRELDVRPGILTRVEPEYPEAAARRFLSGRVVLRLYIEEDGRVSRVAVLGAEPSGYFEDSASRAFSAARFTPGMKGGRAVRVQMTLEVSFESPPAPELPEPAPRS